MKKARLQAKRDERFRAAVECFTRGYSLQKTADQIGLSKTQTYRLYQRWQDSTKPATNAAITATGKDNLSAVEYRELCEWAKENCPQMLATWLEGGEVPAEVAAEIKSAMEAAPQQSRHYIDQARKVVSGTAEERIEALTVQLLRWSGVTRLADVVFEQIYKFCNQVAPNTQRRNDLFLRWMESQVYPGGPDDPTAVKDVAVADPPTSAEPEAPTEILNVASEEEISQARKWAETVLHSYDISRLPAYYGPLIEIARNEEALFSKEQVERAQRFVDNPLYGKRPGA